MIRYVTSALEPATWPNLRDPSGSPLPEIALAGRSNVGKSTFVNLAAGNKHLAKVSATPGKTQRLEFFCLDEAIALVDLPGFGYANAPLAAQLKWSQAIDHYLKTSRSLKAVFLFLDIRRDPSSEELGLIAWSKERGIGLLPVFTKTDKLSPKEFERKKGTNPFPDALFLPAPKTFILRTLERFAHETR